MCCAKADHIRSSDGRAAYARRSHATTSSTGAPCVRSRSNSQSTGRRSRSTSDQDLPRQGLSGRRWLARRCGCQSQGTRDPGSRPQRARLDGARRHRTPDPRVALSHPTPAPSERDQGPRARRAFPTRTRSTRLVAIHKEAIQARGVARGRPASRRPLPPKNTPPRLECPGLFVRMANRDNRSYRVDSSRFTPSKPPRREAAPLETASRSRKGTSPRDRASRRTP